MVGQASAHPTIANPDLVIPAKAGIQLVHLCLRASPSPATVRNWVSHKGTKISRLPQGHSLPANIASAALFAGTNRVAAKRALFVSLYSTRRRAVVEAHPAISADLCGPLRFCAKLLSYMRPICFILFDDHAHIRYAASRTDRCAARAARWPGRTGAGNRVSLFFLMAMRTLRTSSHISAAPLHYKPA